MGSLSGRAPRVRDAGVDSGDHPWGNRHGVRASNAVGRLRENRKVKPRGGGAVGTAVAQRDHR